MATSFSHVCIVSEHPLDLAEFYTAVFSCERSGPDRDLSVPALAKGMGLPGAHVKGIHLTLPGGGSGTLEIFSLPDMIEGTRATNALGLMHLSFRVDDLAVTVDGILARGGSLQGEVAELEVAGVGSAAFVYAKDPDGNLIEVQQWMPFAG